MTTFDAQFSQSGFKYPERIYGQRYQAEPIVKPLIQFTRSSPNVKVIKFQKFGINLGPERPVIPRSKLYKEPFHQNNVNSRPGQTITYEQNVQPPNTASKSDSRLRNHFHTRTYSEPPPTSALVSTQKPQQKMKISHPDYYSYNNGKSGSSQGANLLVRSLNDGTLDKKRGEIKSQSVQRVTSQRPVIGMGGQSTNGGKTLMRPSTQNIRQFERTLKGATANHQSRSAVKPTAANSIVMFVAPNPNSKFKTEEQLFWKTSNQNTFVISKGEDKRNADDFSYSRHKPRATSNYGNRLNTRTDAVRKQIGQRANVSSYHMRLNPGQQSIYQTRNNQLFNNPPSYLPPSQDCYKESSSQAFLTAEASKALASKLQRNLAVVPANSARNLPIRSAKSDMFDNKKNRPDFARPQNSITSPKRALSKGNDASVRSSASLGQRAYSLAQGPIYKGRQYSMMVKFKRDLETNLITRDWKMKTFRGNFR